MRYLVRVVPVLALLLAAALSGAPARAQGQEIEVRIDDFAFDPPTITVNVGDTVTWVNYDEGIPHNAHALDDTFETEVVDGSAQGTVSGSYTFTAADVGTHEYQCDVHPNMRGTVIVQAAAQQEEDDDQGADQQEEAQDEGTPQQLPDTGAGGMAAGAGLPLASLAAFVSLLAAGGYALVRRR